MDTGCQTCLCDSTQQGDLPNVVDGQFLSDELNHYQAPVVEASAIEGLGVAETSRERPWTLFRNSSFDEPLLGFVSQYFKSFVNSLGKRSFVIGRQSN